MALIFSPEPKPQWKCPDFKLPGVDSNTHSRDDLALGHHCLLIMFICNHCPYVKAIEDRLIALGNLVQPMGCQVVAICSNDSEDYPDDSFQNLKKRSFQKNYPFPYLHDESQATAHSFGAVCTPDFFLFDSALTLQYRGRLDDSWKDSSKVTKEELKDAILCLIVGKSIATPQNPSMGCSIKWK